MQTSWLTLRKSLLLIGAMFVTGTLLAETTLSFWSWRQEDVKAYNEIIAEFEKSNPGIKVKYTAHEAKSYNTILTTALAAGSGPDIIHTRSYGSLEKISKPGYLEPLDGKVDLKLLSADELGGTTLRADGRVYAVPFASQTLLLYYNKDVFSDKGIAIPATWDEFKAASRKLKAAGVTPLANGTKDGWTAEVMGGIFMPNFYGKAFFNDVKAGQTNFDDSRYVGALEKMLELKEFMPNGFEGVDHATMIQLFVSSQAAMFAGGSWEIPGFRKAGINFGIMPAPGAWTDSTRLVSSFLDGGYGVNAASKNKEAALEFIRFTATQPFGQMLTDKLANVSTIEGAVSSDPLLAQIAEMHNNATPYIMLVGYRFNKPTGSTMLQNGLQQIYAGTKTPVKVAKDIVDGMKAWDN